MTLVVVSLFTYFLVKLNILTMFDQALPKFSHLLVFLAIISTVIGAVVAFFTSKIPLQPFQKMLNHINRLAAGDFTARLHFGRIMGKHPDIKRLTNSFNTLAEELQNTQMLRSDFVNNFSHEFKTPIVSIAGFAKLLRRGNLTEKQKEEYLAIIEEESMRLSYMATNILHLTQIENQSILTDVSQFNLSEQIRASVLLLESKWAEKNLELHIDFDEYEITANEELLKQVWINLIDNAIKFSPDYGILEIVVSEKNNNMIVSVTNSGEPIPENARKKIFNKFYQADESHVTEGNGIGLAVVMGVVTLHNGTVFVESNEIHTTFTVTLPFCTDFELPPVYTVPMLPPEMFISTSPFMILLKF